jgi:asparagine synthase (glutamine-hydrolysing)
MCGICGIYNFDNSAINKNSLERMNNSMYLRGPDDSGFYIDGSFGMAMRRLSIIDIEHGQQPISNSDNTIHVVFNGEIYNYIELRDSLKKKGYIFKTESDTEVLIFLYEEYGLNAVNYLTGMFVFSIWDEKKKRLWVVRDHLGVKPLVYFTNNNVFIFASTVDALSKHPEFKKEVDKESLLLYFMLSYIPAPRTFWKGVHKLLPGHYMLIEDGKLQTKRYWNLEPKHKLNMHEATFTNKVKGVIKQSIELHSRSDVPVGSFLSGGVDSGIVTSMFCKSTKKDIHTFTADFEGKTHNENKEAVMVANMYRTKHHSYVIDMDSALRELEELVGFIDEPMSDSAIIPSYILSKEARKNRTKVVLNGAGGDELFGGYYRHYRHLKNIFFGKLRFIPIGFLVYIGRALGRNVQHYLMLGWSKELEFGISTSGVHLGLFEKIIRNSDDFKQAVNLTKGQFSCLPIYEKKWGFKYGRMLTDINNYLVDNVLAITDKSSMASSVEARVPLLDRNLAELAFNIPGGENIGNNFQNAKHTLKSAFKKYLPVDILNRKKNGFNAPVYDWIGSKNSKIGKRVCNPKSILIRKLFDTKAIKEVWENDKDRVTACETIFMIYVLDLWLEKHA